MSERKILKELMKSGLLSDIKSESYWTSGVHERSSKKTNMEFGKEIKTEDYEHGRASMSMVFKTRRLDEIS